MQSPDRPQTFETAFGDLFFLSREQNKLSGVIPASFIGFSFLITFLSLKSKCIVESFGINGLSFWIILVAGYLKLYKEGLFLASYVANLIMFCDLIPI